MHTPWCIYSTLYPTRLPMKSAFFLLAASLLTAGTARSAEPAAVPTVAVASSTTGGAVSSWCRPTGWSR